MLREGYLYRLPMSPAGFAPGPNVVAADVDANGAILYTQSEWRAEEKADHTVDKYGYVLFQGRTTGWMVGDLSGPGDTLGTCLYCYSVTWPVDSVPPCDDDEAWTDLAADHRAECEWIYTRAHQLMPETRIALGEEAR